MFRDYRLESDEMILKAFTTDKQYMKTPKFIKDKQDLEEVEKILLKYFRQLKQQFNYQIANGGQSAYPAIGLLGYADQCYKWRVFGPTLSQQDVDRQFIATNYDEAGLEDNEENSLCRYEFLEILVRLAKTKYHEKGICKTISASLEKILYEHVLPNHAMSIMGQQFRDDQLWTLEIDDLFKANMEALNHIFRTHQ